MPAPDFFARLGFWVRERFLPAPVCADLRTQIKQASNHQATVVDNGRSMVNEAVRRVQWAEISGPALTLVESRLKGLRPKLEQHFGLSLEFHQLPQFLRYRPGDFFSAHRDSEDGPTTPGFIRARRISVVLFLNNETSSLQPDCYTGGSLVLYGLKDDPRWQGVGFPLVGREGLLMAFPSRLYHEVTPVVAGERYTIVTWFC